MRATAIAANLLAQRPRVADRITARANFGNAGDGGMPKFGHLTCYSVCYSRTRAPFELDAAAGILACWAFGWTGANVRRLEGVLVRRDAQSRHAPSLRR